MYGSTYIREFKKITLIVNEISLLQAAANGAVKTNRNINLLRLLQVQIISLKK